MVLANKMSSVRAFCVTDRTRPSRNTVKLRHTHGHYAPNRASRATSRASNDSCMDALAASSPRGRLGLGGLRRNGTMKRSSVAEGLVDVITLYVASRAAFLDLTRPLPADEAPSGTGPIVTLREISLNDLTATPDASIAAQERARSWLVRVFPKGSRADSTNLDPLQAWRTGAQIVALNLQTNDLPTQVMALPHSHKPWSRDKTQT